MKFFSFKNFILGLFISIGLFIGLGSLSFGNELTHFTFGGSTSGTTFNGTVASQRTSLSSASEDCWTFIQNPVLQIRCTQTTAFTYPMSWEFHVVTTAGDFVCSTGTVSSLTASSWTQLITNKYTNNFLGAIQYVYVTCNYTRTNTTLITWSGNFDVELRDTENEVWNKTNNLRINETLTNTQLILDSLGGGSKPDLANLPNGYTPALFAFDHTLSNGNEYISNDPIFNIEYPDTTFYSDSRSLDIINTVPFGSRSYLFTLSFDTPMDSADSWVVQLGFNSNGSSTDVITDPFQSVYNRSSGRVIFYKQLNDITDLSRLYFIVAQNVGVRSLTNIKYSAFVLDQSSSDWSVIADSTSLSDLNGTSSAVSNIISDNGNFESEAFTSFDSNLDDFGFDDWSLVPISSELATTKNIITMFYNVLPFKIQWLFTTVMALGLIMMLLTVGTRVVQRTGEFTRAKPVKMSKSKGGK